MSVQTLNQVIMYLNYNSILSIAVILNWQVATENGSQVCSERLQSVGMDDFELWRCPRSTFQTNHRDHDQMCAINDHM